MSIITYTRDAKCKDCKHIRYFYEGKRKYHFCLKKNENRTLNSGICDEYEYRIGYYIKKLIG